MQAFFCRIPIRCIEDRPDVSSYFNFHGLAWNVRSGILLQVQLAALPGNTPKNSASVSPQTLMTVTDNQFHSMQPSIFQALQKVFPIGFLLAQREREKTLRLVARLGDDPSGNQDRCIPNLAVFTHFLIASIQIQVCYLSKWSISPFQ